MSGHRLSSLGGALFCLENVKVLKEHGSIIWLTADPQTIYERVHTFTHRPLLNNDMSVDHIAKLLEARLPAYEAASEIIVATDGKTINQISAEILAAIHNK